MQALRQDIETAPCGEGLLGAPESVAGPAVLSAEWVDLGCLRDHLGAWRDLCERALEPNIFLDPAFALPLLEHAPTSSLPRFLLVWEGDGSTIRGSLAGLFPLLLPRLRNGVCTVPVHEQTSLGAPLVDRERAADVIESVLTWLGSGHAPRRAGALAISAVSKDGALASELRRVCASSLRPFVVLDEKSRAVLNRSQGDDGRVAAFPSAKRRQQYARQGRRLARAGERKLRSEGSASEVAAASERFLVLEHKGWKGARGTALLAVPGLARFARTMTRAMADDGKCRIDSIEINGRPVAMMIVLTAGDRAYFWKTAFDEAYAPYSPGVLLTLEVTRKQLSDPRLIVTDSCAAPDHPVIDRLWPDRIAMIDLLVAIAPGGGRTFELCLLAERARRGARQTAKDLWFGARRLWRQLK